MNKKVVLLGILLLVGLTLSGCVAMGGYGYGYGGYGYSSGYGYGYYASPYTDSGSYYNHYGYGYPHYPYGKGGNYPRPGHDYHYGR
jgi:hypothetical protein